MAKMHELLAVEKDVKAFFQKILAETQKVFAKGTHFTGMTKVHRYLSDEDQKNLPAVQTERKEQASSVMERLLYQAKAVGNYYDLLLQKNRTNQLAMADIVIDGVTIGTNLPATFLMEMKEKLNDLRKTIAGIPTRSNTVAWELNPDRKFTSKTKYPIESFQGRTTIRAEVVHPHQFPNKEKGEHGAPIPAVVKEFSETENIGVYTTTHLTGEISSADKAAMLARVDTCLIAFKKAQSQANNAEVAKGKVGKNILDYIYGNLA